MKRVTVKVISNEQILKGLSRPQRRNIAGSWIIWLRCPEIAHEASPGQFVMVRCGEDCTLPRPFSIHRISDEGIALFYAVWEDGKGTNWLSRRHKGDGMELFGPLGNGFSMAHSSHNLLLVAGGIGIAPLVFLADEAVKQEKMVTLLMGAPSAVHLLPTEQNAHGLLTDGVLPFNINIVKVTEDGSEGFKGLATDLIVNHVDQTDQIFACGPPLMYKTMAQMPELKDKLVQASLETRMGCGLGVCYGCTIRTKNGLKQVCKDGPVFDLEDILWDEWNLPGGGLP